MMEAVNTCLARGVPTVQHAIMIQRALINVGCDYSCLGCTNPCSGNYDASATIDNGSCQPVLGCMDETACNYDACADLNYGCDYLDACGICDGPWGDL